MAGLETIEPLITIIIVLSVGSACIRELANMNKNKYEEKD